MKRTFFFLGTLDVEPKLNFDTKLDLEQESLSLNVILIFEEIT